MCTDTCSDTWLQRKRQMQFFYSWGLQLLLAMSTLRKFCSIIWVFVEFRVGQLRQVLSNISGFAEPASVTTRHNHIPFSHQHLIMGSLLRMNQTLW
jgi:hypothetical protein